MLPDLNFKQANTVFNAPEGSNDIAPLKAFVGTSREGYPLIISKWNLSKEDIETINAGGSIYLCMYSHNLPPVLLTTENPF